MSLRTARLRANKGARLLDEELPDWFERIDLEHLNLGEPDRCVLGQCFRATREIPRWSFAGYDCLEAALADSLDDAEKPICSANYDVGRYVLGLDDTDLVRFGFNTGRIAPGVAAADVSFLELDEAWSALVYNRQRAWLL